MNRFFRKIHLWLSLPFGLIITVICFSGAMLVFENEVMQLTRRDLYRVERTATERLPIGTLAAQVAAALPDSVAVTGVTIYADPRRTCEVSLSRPRRASLFADPYTGAIKGRSERAPFFTCMFRLHRWLSDNMRPEGGVFVGKLVVGVSTLAFAIVLVSGIAVWWPRTRKTLRHTLKIDVRKGWKKFWHDLHVAGGMYALVFLLAMALTGLTWSFSWYRTGFYKLFGAESHQESRHEPGGCALCPDKWRSARRPHPFPGQGSAPADGGCGQTNLERIVTGQGDCVFRPLAAGVRNTGVWQSCLPEDYPGRRHGQRLFRPPGKPACRRPLPVRSPHRRNYRSDALSGRRPRRQTPRLDLLGARRELGRPVHPDSRLCRRHAGGHAAHDRVLPVDAEEIRQVEKGPGRKTAIGAAAGQNDRTKYAGKSVIPMPPDDRCERDPGIKIPE